MAIRTIGSAGDHAYTEAGINSAVAAASSGDTIRFIQNGTISLAAQISLGGKVLILDYIGYTSSSVRTTWPKLDGGGASIKAFDDPGAGSSFSGLQFSNFNLTGGGFAGGVINCRSRVVNGEGLYFIDCNECLQSMGGGTWKRLWTLRTGALFRIGDGLTVRKFEVRVKDGGTRAIDLNGTAAASDFAMGSIYMTNNSSGDIAMNVGATCPIKNVSVKRNSSGAGTAFAGTVSYCTQSGFNTAISGTNGGNNNNRDPLFTDPAAGDFSWQAGSSEYESGTAISGETIDINGLALPAGSSWPRGSQDLLTTVSVSSIDVLSSTSIRLNLSASMATDASWSTAGNYTTTTGAGAAVSVLSATPNANPATSVVLVTTEHTQGSSYTAAWAGVTSLTNGSMGYTGQGAAPTLSSAVAVSSYIVDVVFSEDMTNDAALIDAANYVLTRPGHIQTAVTTVTRVSATAVRLTCTDPLWAGYTYTLTVSGPTDLAGNPASAAVTTFSSFAATFLSVVVVSTTSIKLRFTAANPTASLSSTGNYTLAKRTPEMPGVLPTVSTIASAANVGNVMEVVLTTTAHTNLQGYRVTWLGLTYVTSGYGDYVGTGTQPVVTVAGAFMPPTIKAYVAAASSRLSKSSLSGWTEVGVVYTSDRSIQLVLPTSGTSVDVLLSVDVGARSLRRVKRAAYTYP